MARRRVLVTGATGTMGSAVLAELLERGEVDIVALVHNRPGHRVHATVPDVPGVTIAPGDLRDRDSLMRAAAGCELIVHCGGLVSPLADARPHETMQVNTVGMAGLIAAARRNDAAIVNIGSVAMYGDRPPPVHWGRVGDPLKISPYDAYAVSKVRAERMLIDSGLRWASLRQTGIVTPTFFTLLDPIMYHAPPHGVMEWVTPEASARLVASICSPDCPPEFWGRAYNVGGGPGWRTTNLAFMVEMLQAIGVRDPLAWFRPRWFATQGFHGLWFGDGDELQRLFGFQQGSLADEFPRIAALAPRFVRWARACPAWLARVAVMGPMARNGADPLAWVSHGHTGRIAAHLGSLEQWRALPPVFSEADLAQPSVVERVLERGFDPDAGPREWRGALLAHAAAFRGGVVLDAREPTRRARWRCARDHVFRASPVAVLQAGHWCPRCQVATSDYPRLAAESAFFAQVWV